MDAEPDAITPQVLADMSDTEIAKHAAGSYGARKRRLLEEAIRQALRLAGVRARNSGPKTA